MFLIFLYICKITDCPCCSYSIYLMHWIHIHCSSFLLLSQSVILLFPTSLRAQARHYTHGWQLLAISINVIAYTVHVKRYEMETWWLKRVCSMVLGVLTLTAHGIVFQRQDMLFFSFAFKVVIMMSLTWQPDDGWIVQQCTVS